MPIVKKNEQLPPRPVIILIYGEPGTGKTSLFNTCNNPLLLDFDKGVDRSHGRKDTFVIANYKELLEADEQGELNNHATIGIDTPKAFLDDYLMVHVIENDAAMKRNKLKAFGEIGSEFKLFVNKRRNSNVDIVMMVHSASDKEGDVTKHYPDVTGGSLQLLKRISDQVGYMYIDNNRKRVIDFRPSDSLVGKDVAGLGLLYVPEKNDPGYSNFFDVAVVQKVKDGIAKMTTEQLEALKLIEDFQGRIDTIEGGNEALSAMLTDIKALPEAHLSKQLIVYMNAHMKRIGWKWDKKAEAFVLKEEPKDETPRTDASPQPDANEPTVNASSGGMDVQPPAAITPPAEEKPVIVIPEPVGPRIGEVNTDFRTTAQTPPPAEGGLFNDPVK